MKRQKSSVEKKSSFKEQSKKVSLGSKISAALKKAKQKRTDSSKSASRKTTRRIAKKVNLNLVQQEISQAKFNVGAPAHQGYVTHTPSQDLPGRYHEDKIVVQVRDPWWIHTYWEVRNTTVEDIKNRLGTRFHGAKAVLRVYDVSFINFNGNNAHGHFDIEVGLEAQSWYIDVGSAGRSWCIDIGFRLNDGTFILIARSNVVTTPLDGPSWITDEEWMVPEEIFTRLYGMGFGMGPASPTAKSLIKRVKGERLRMQHISSPALFSMSSPRKVFIKKGKKGFWLIVNTELIVYGATEPDAKVTVQGKPIKLNSDGTFSLRFALPDGKQTIPVEARSADGEDYRSVTPVVSKKTQ